MWVYVGSRLCGNDNVSWSGAEDTIRATLLMNLVVNRSTWGFATWNRSPDLLKDTWTERPLCLDGLTHEREFVCYDIQSPWDMSGLICLNTDLVVLHQVRILHSRAHRGPDLMPPCLYM